jgi:hypothetical protein
VLASRGPAGVNVAVFPDTLTVPETVPTPPVNWNVVVLTVVGLTTSESVARTTASIATSVSPWSGSVEVTVGRVTSGGGAVVKVQTTSAARLFPARSSTPVVTRTVYVAFAASGAEGVKVATCPESETLPETADVPRRRRYVVPFTRRESQAPRT